jgi:hypothetical protein
MSERHRTTMARVSLPPDRAVVRLPVTVAWLLAALTVVSVAPNVGLLLVPVRPGLIGTDASPIQVLFDAAFLAISPAMGLLIVRRHPSNPVGWLFVVLPALLSLGFLGDSVARHAAPSSAVGWFVLVSSSASNAGFLALVLLLALFPNGQLVSPRWRVVPALGIVATVCLVASSVLTPRLIDDIPQIQNPLGRPELADFASELNAAASLAIVVALALAIAQFVARFRRADLVERQQLKWFGFATSIIGALLVVAGTAQFLLPAVGGPIEAIGDFAWAAAFSCFAFIPVAAAIAMLRYRLYEIDRIISRTVAYALVTGLLAGAYIVAFLGLQAALASFTANEAPMVAVSTLVVFALFTPLRRRMSAIVDRRFNRRRYDADRIVDEFGARLRDDLDIDTLAHAIRAVALETVEPASAGIWLATGEPR